MKNMKRECHHPKTITKRLESYKEDLLGTPVVLLDSVEAEVCTECGEHLAICIPDQDGLVSAMALVRVENTKKKLSAKEIRFVRKALGFTSKEMAKHMTVSAEHYSRWENEDNKQPFTAQNEKLFRMIAQAVLQAKAPGIFTDPEKVALSEYVGVWENCCDDPMTFQRILVRKEGSKEPEYDWSLAVESKQRAA